jgi:LuxR family transcriptional regulator, maltose regulon positive regulatory protein
MHGFALLVFSSLPSYNHPQSFVGEQKYERDHTPMPKSAQYVVNWSAEQGKYLLTELGNGASRLVPEEEGWQHWLQEYHSFAFHGRNGQVNLLKEKRSRGENDYWYAYQRHGRKMVKQYAGRSVQLSMERLEEIATLLAKKDEAMSSPLSAVETHRSP